MVWNRSFNIISKLLKFYVCTPKIRQSFKKLGVKTRTKTIDPPLSALSSHGVSSLSPIPFFLLSFFFLPLFSILPSLPLFFLPFMTFTLTFSFNSPLFFFQFLPYSLREEEGRKKLEEGRGGKKWESEREGACISRLLHIMTLPTIHIPSPIYLSYLSLLLSSPFSSSFLSSSCSATSIHYVCTCQVIKETCYDVKQGGGG